MTHVNPQEAFEAAIQLGLFTTDEADEAFAGNYMYMFTDETKGHAFKHRDTREYVYTA